MKRMDFQDRLFSHGLRSMASTILNVHGWDPELFEVALAHVDKDEVRSAYNRTDFSKRGRPMMAKAYRAATSIMPNPKPQRNKRRRKAMS